jgi:hypothetical protein
MSSLRVPSFRSASSLSLFIRECVADHNNAFERGNSAAQLQKPRGLLARILEMACCQWPDCSHKRQGNRVSSFWISKRTRTFGRFSQS